MAPYTKQPNAIATQSFHPTPEAYCYHLESLTGFQPFGSLFEEACHEVVARNLALIQTCLCQGCMDLARVYFTCTDAERHMEMRCKAFIFLLVVLWIDLLVFSLAFSQEKEKPGSALEPGKLALVQAAMCEGIKDYNPYNKAVVFSVDIGKVSCFTSFDPVPEEMFIYHNWFNKDRLSTKIKLFLQPPRWSTFSSIQLREADKGPWRVEVTDQEGNVLEVLRFSITD